MATRVATMGRARTGRQPARQPWAVWAGAGLLLVGAFLPWVTAQLHNALGSFAQSASGFDLNEGKLSLGVGIAGAVAGLIPSRRRLSARFIGISILVTGVAVIMLAGEVILGGGQQSFGGGFARVSYASRPAVGAFVSAVAGILLAIGGLVQAVRAPVKSGIQAG